MNGQDLQKKLRRSRTAALDFLITYYKTTEENKKTAIPLLIQDIKKGGLNPSLCISYGRTTAGRMKFFGTVSSLDI